MVFRKEQALSLNDEYPKDYVFDGKMAALSNVTSEMKGSGAERMLVITRTYTFSDGTSKDIVESVESPEAAPVVAEKPAKKTKAKRKGIFGGTKKKK